MTDNVNEGPIDVINTVNITEEKMEITSSLGNKYVFEGIKIQEGNEITAEKVKELLQNYIDNKNLCPSETMNLNLQFTERIPSSVTWYNYYISAETKKINFSSLNQGNTIDNVDSTINLPIGLDMVYVSDSKFPSDKHYRTIRIVCDFDGQTVEYYIFI